MQRNMEKEGGKRNTHPSYEPQRREGLMPSTSESPFLPERDGVRFFRTPYLVSLQFQEGERTEPLLAYLSAEGGQNSLSGFLYVQMDGGLIRITLPEDATVDATEGSDLFVDFSIVTDEVLLDRLNELQLVDAQGNVLQAEQLLEAVQQQQGLPLNAAALGALSLLNDSGKLPGKRKRSGPSRRDFLRMGALVTAGTALVSCAPTPTPEPDDTLEPTPIRFPTPVPTVAGEVQVVEQTAVPEVILEELSQLFLNEQELLIALDSTVNQATNTEVRTLVRSLFDGFRNNAPYVHTVEREGMPRIDLTITRFKFEMTKTIEQEGLSGPNIDYSLGYGGLFSTENPSAEELENDPWPTTHLDDQQHTGLIVPFFRRSNWPVGPGTIDLQDRVNFGIDLTFTMIIDLSRELNFEIIKNEAQTAQQLTALKELMTAAVTLNIFSQAVGMSENAVFYDENGDYVGNVVWQLLNLDNRDGGNLRPITDFLGLLLTFFNYRHLINGLQTRLDPGWLQIFNTMNTDIESNMLDLEDQQTLDQQVKAAIFWTMQNIHLLSLVGINYDSQSTIDAL